MLKINISFPKKNSTILTSQEYMDFFSSQESAFPKKNQVSLTLTNGDENAFEGLRRYLQQPPQFFAQELIIHLQPSAFLDEEVLKLMSDKGVITVKLIANELNHDAAPQLLEAVKKHKLTLNIELWAGNEAVQQELDQQASVFQRETRIAAFGQMAPEPKHSIDKNKPKRTRKINAARKVEIDTEIEVQVEITAEVAVEKAVQKQFEAKNNPDLIDRAEFVRRAKAQEFKIAPSSYETLKGFENRTWDRWMGNIHQAVVGPAKKRQKVGIKIEGEEKGEELESYYRIVGLPTEPQIIYHYQNHSKNNWGSTDIAISHISLEEINAFLKQFFPEVTDNKYCSKELTDAQWDAARPPNYPHLYKNHPIYIEDEKELWKGEYVTDADTLAEDQASLDMLKSTCPIPFKKPEVSLRLFTNPKISMMTPEACEQLLEHQAQLGYGLDGAHLPAGFELLEELVDEKLVNVLNYDERKAQLKSKDPYAIHLHKSEPLQPLSYDLFNRWLINSSDTLLKQQYDLLEKTFDRTQIAQFQRYLPVMLQLPTNLLTKFGKEAKDFIQAAIHHKSYLTTIKGKLNSHLLIQFLENEDDKEIIKLLGQWHARLDFTAADLNALLAVYNSYGTKGLAALFNVWEKACIKIDEEIVDDSLLRDLKESYFPYCESFVPLLDPSFEFAVNILKHLPQEERHFWNTLFTQHMAAVGYDELLPLVKAFQDFSTQIKEKNLAFYDKCHFAQVKNLQTALSRMLSILNHTNPLDLPLVWKQITGLDLQSNGAIRLLDDSNSTASQGQWILPDMKLSPEHYAEQHDYRLYKNIANTKNFTLPEHGYLSLQAARENPKKIPFWNNHFGIYAYYLGNPNSMQEIIAYSKNPQELKKNYYRYLAAQPHRLSLDTYQKAAHFMDSTINDMATRAGFYALIAAATSGYKASSQVSDETQVLASLSSLWEIFDEIKLPTGIPVPNSVLHHEVLFSFIKMLLPMPPLPYALQLMRLMQKAFTFNWSYLNTIREGSVKLQDCLVQISRISECYGYAFYEGIKFIDIKLITYKKCQEFVDLAIDIQFKLNAAKNVPCDSLIRLMSTFQLDKEITKTLSTFKDESFNTLLSTCLSFLTQMQTNSSPKLLTQADLLEFIHYLEEQYALKPPGLGDDQLAIQCVQKKFGAYFTKDFFNEFHIPGLSATLEKNITRNFDTLEEQHLITRLLLSFSNQNGREETLNHLIQISKRLSAQERKYFLTLLTTLNSQHDNKLTELNVLLGAIGERGNINDFIFMVERASQTEPVSHLIFKITLYYQQVVPFLYGKKWEHFSLTDLQPLAAQLVFNASEEPKQFNTSFIKIMNKLEEIVDYCPAEKQGILTLLREFINASKNQTDYQVLSFVTYLTASAKFLGSADIIRSLSDHYHDKPLELYSLLEMIKDPDKWDQRAILLMITSLLNNGCLCSLETIKEFLELCQQQDKKTSPAEKSPLFLLSEQFFKCPPYPTLEQIIAWHKEHQGASNYKKKMTQSYQQHSLKPCVREPENGFKLNEALNLASRFQGITFEKKELNALAKETKAVTAIETIALKQELKALAALTEAEREQQHPRLLAILSELLYRSKGSAGGHGLSYELNTVQYLAVFAFLKSKGHMTAEMATGEGKSRTMMMAIACEFALNKTVDFVTSDMQLALRDYLEYQAFFKLLEAPTRLITSSSNANSYQVRGIHFSDASNLSLFRNKARSQLSGAQVIDPQPTNRSLLLDEADRIYFDISETRFNYSDLPKDNALKNMEWIYPFLVRFFNQADAQKKARCAYLYEHDIEECTAAFIEYIQAQPDYKEEMLAQIESISPAQLESWQEAAVTALNLKLGTDYALEPNVLIETHRGPKLATEARLIYGHRLSKNSKFSFGVYQCLHAHLNNELQNPNSATSLKCAQLLRQQNKEDKQSPVTVSPFFIHPEKQIVYSTTSKSFLDEYQSGTVWAITGTGGAILEKEEAAGLYGKNTPAHNAMEFITVPRKNNLQRTDHPLRLTGNFKQRVAAILEYIVEARKAGRPVLLICEDDTQASLIQKALDALLKTYPESERIPEEQWQFVDSTSTSMQEQVIIANAGKPGVVTISTSRLARGTDIKLTKESKAAGGLRVLGSYLPRERDQWQIFGRSGRYGDLGDTRLIVDKQQLSQRLGKKDLDANFFLANEFYLQSQQARMDKEKQIERLIRHSLSDFRIKITDAFFTYYDDLAQDASEDNKMAVDYWAQFTKKTDQLWNQLWPQLDHLAKKPQVNISQIKALLAQFKQQAQTEWNILHTQLKADSNKLPERLDDLTLNSRTEHLLRLIQPKRRYTRQDRTQVYQAYDKAFDGRAIIYDELFTELKATWRGERKLLANTRAWWNGHGILFADTRALFSGKRPLFATLRAWMNKDKIAKKEQHRTCHNILEALEQHNSEELNYYVRHQDATQLLQPATGDLLLSFKIQLIETILDYAHSQLERKNKMTKKDMNIIRNLLILIKETPADQPLLISSLMKEIQPLKNGFFGHALKKEVNGVIKQRQQEQTEEEPPSKNSP
jgi:hypothetical protein